MSWEGRFSGLLVEREICASNSSCKSLLDLGIDPDYFNQDSQKNKLLCLLEREPGSLNFDEYRYFENIHFMLKIGEKSVIQLGSGKSDEILEEGDKYRIISRDNGYIPSLILDKYELSKEDRIVLQSVQKKAIAEISFDKTENKNKETKSAVYKKEVDKIINLEYFSLSPESREGICSQIVQNIMGLGLLEPLLELDNLEEIMVNGISRPVHVNHRKFGICKTNIFFESEAEIKNIINRIASPFGKQVDLRSPFLDTRLPDGSRVNATIFPVSLDGPTITIRKFKRTPITTIDLINSRTVSPEALAFIWLITEGFSNKPANILIAGGTGSGKTTALNCICSFIPATERIVSLEDTAELQLPSKHWIRLEAIPSNIEGRGKVHMDMLLKNCLRMNPSRIIMGEVRGNEALTLAASMNVGQDGTLGTIHSNSAMETITRLEAEPMNVPRAMISALDFIIVLRKFFHKGKSIRRIIEISEVRVGDNGNLGINPIYKRNSQNDSLTATGNSNKFIENLAKQKGITEEEISSEIQRRENFLVSLAEQNIREQEKVGLLIDQYYKKPGFWGYMGSDFSLEEKNLENIEDDINYFAPFLKLSKIERKKTNQIEKEAVKKISINPTEIKEKDLRFRTFTIEVENIIKNGFFGISPEKIDKIAHLISHNMLGYGLLDYLLEDDKLEEIFVIGSGMPVYVNHVTRGILRTNILFDNDREILRIINRIAGSINRRVDRSSPLLDARLPDGSRVNATIPPVSINGPTITIRRKRKRQLTITDLLLNNTINPTGASFLWLMVEGLGQKPVNLIVAGGTGSGKTTFLNILCSFIPPGERIITMEDTAELIIPHEHVVRLETRPPSVEGEGEITLDDLVKNSLRMNPNRIIIGEVRGKEARTIFTAMNTGHDGGMGTIHANSAGEVLIRLRNPPLNVPSATLSVLELIIIQKKIIESKIVKRRISEIVEVIKSDSGEIGLNPIFIWDRATDSLVSTGNPCNLLENLARISGLDEGELKHRQKEIEEKLIFIKNNKIFDSSRLSEIIHGFPTKG